MKRILGIALAGTLALTATPSAAEIGTIDNVPAATLLLPYFEVDLADPFWQTTLFSINNAAETPAIAHVVLWTDQSVPTLDFNVYLTGYDVVTINLRDLFQFGETPQTSHNDTGVSPVGVFSAVSDPLSGVGPGSVSCDDQLPLIPVPSALLQHVRDAHTGKPSSVFGGLCSGRDHGDEIARGYITIDNVNFCTLDFPGDQGYFIDGGQGAASNQNQLWGDVLYSQGLHNTSQGISLVHIEASSDDPRTQAGQRTFYARYSGGTDNREGLATSHGLRFVNGGAFDGGSDVVVWREGSELGAPFVCGTAGPNGELSQTAIIVFDEEENPDFIDGGSPFSPPIPGVSLFPFPLEANRVPVGEEALPTEFSFGWLYLNLDLPETDEPEQSWAGVIMEASDRFSLFTAATQFDNVSDPLPSNPPVCDGDPDPDACN